jgi:hypothetical protein
MLRGALIFLLVVHGLVHLLGVAKAFQWAEVSALTRPIGRSAGVGWAAAAMLFLLAALAFWRHHERWWMVATVAVVLSQVLIWSHGREAAAGGIANLLVMVTVVLAVFVWRFRQEYRSLAQMAMSGAAAVHEHIITEADLSPLPPPVQRYLRAAGVVGRPRPRSMLIRFRGEIRGFDGPWMPFTTVQVNRFDVPERHFWMDATMKGLPTKGLHSYKDGTARMTIKPLGAFPAVDLFGPVLDTSETVTWFNDLCLMAPGALLDPRITWRSLDDRSAEATFSHRGITISAVLVFDAQDRLIDFISNDRSALMPDGTFERMRFSTPCRSFSVEEGVRVARYGEAVYHRPGGPFTYGRFTLLELIYDPEVGMDHTSTR